MNAGIDWDAATAAALVDGVADPAIDDLWASSTGPRGADELLEDIIREIVGDAAADTVSSLHHPRESVADHASARGAAGTYEWFDACR